MSSWGRFLIIIIWGRYLQRNRSLAVWGRFLLGTISPAFVSRHYMAKFFICDTYLIDGWMDGQEGGRVTIRTN